MRIKQVLSIVLISLTYYSFITRDALHPANPGNSAPLVRITSPPADGKFTWDGMVNYSISIEDKEDGSSVYNEIEASEVLLKVVYLPDSSKVNKYLSGERAVSFSQAPGLTLIKTSACFSCHAAAGKLIGPSFQLIAAKYKNKSDTMANIAKRIIQGSSGIWGNIPMPPHPGLNELQARQAVQWILKNNTNPDITYYPGLQGSFHTRAKPLKDSGKGVYVLTASYTDHGVKDAANSQKQGVYSIILHNR